MNEKNQCKKKKRKKERLIEERKRGIALGITKEVTREPKTMGKHKGNREKKETIFSSNPN
jgi:hypothetical protein